MQSTAYSSVLTDYLMDISEPNAGLSSYKFIYNATSLYRVFSFIDSTPLLNISVTFYWTDTIGNRYPLTVEKGQLPSVKFMFIKKELLAPLTRLLSEI